MKTPDLFHTGLGLQPWVSPGAAQMAYLLGIASEHWVDQLDPVGQAGGNHVAGAVGRPNPLVHSGGQL